MGNAIIIGPLAQSSTELPFYSDYVPAGFPSPAQDHLQQKISLDELLNINARWGRGTLRPAAVPATPEWGMHREMISPSYTTRMDELWQVACR